MRCPQLVGREGEVAALRGRLDELTARQAGGCVVVVGEPGAGKSRLVAALAESAVSCGARVLSGRASAGGSPSPYRPLRDAFLSAFRDASPPSSPSLQGFEGHLARLIPTGSVPAAEDAPVLVAEAALRLLAATAGNAGCVLLLEDLHWADPETVAVVDYLSDALDAQPVLCVCTTRPDGALTDVVERMRRSGRETLELGPLADDDVVRMVAACLGTEDPPGPVTDFVVAHSDGTPLLVEELLAGMVATGQLRDEDGYWEAPGPLTASVPASLRASIRERLGSLTTVERRVLDAAALLGRHFDWNLLPGIAEVDGRAAADGLRAAVAAQLLDVDGTGFVFRHALTREVVLADVLPPERRELAARAWPAVELAHPGLPGVTCELAADLAEAAGAPVAAAERLVESARRALRDGALATAEATARRARVLAAGSEEVATSASEVLVDVLAAAGKPADALALGQALADRVAATAAGSEQHVSLLVAIARAALAAGRVDAAADAVDAARGVLREPVDRVVAARVDAVAAEVALDSTRLRDAEHLARRAIEGARSTAQPAVRCEALLTLGRTLRIDDMAAASACFAEAATVAQEAGLARWHLRAQQELALEEWMRRGAPPMEETRALAARYGAHVTVAVMDLSLADVHLSSYDRERCLRHATACAEASRRFHLATEPVAHLWLAGAHALGGDDDAMQRAIDAAVARDADDPRILGDLFGRVLVTRAFVLDQLDSLRPLTDTMMTHVRRAPPTTSVYPGRILWTLLRTVDDDDLGASAREEFRDVVARYHFPSFIHGAAMIEGAAAGRAGDTERAATMVGTAHRALTAQPYGLGTVHATAVVLARAAIRDGWGAPADWLRAAESFFAAGGYVRLARRCRLLLAQAGAPVPRRRGHTEVPPALRARGVTGREVDVLKLVVAGRTNNEIAEALVLSPKTVERHLSSLFGRLGVRDRRDLAAVGAPHLV